MLLLRVRSTNFQNSQPKVKAKKMKSTEQGKAKLNEINDLKNNNNKKITRVQFRFGFSFAFSRVHFFLSCTSPKVPPAYAWKLTVEYVLAVFVVKSPLGKLHLESCFLHAHENYFSQQYHKKHISVRLGARWRNERKKHMFFSSCCLIKRNE